MNKTLRSLMAALLLGACANLVGITDTEVENAGGQASGGQGNAGTNTSGGDAGSQGKGGSGTSGSTGSAGQDSSGGSDTGGSGAVAGTSSAGAPAAGAGGGGCDCPADTPTCEGGVCIVRGPTMVPVNNFYMDSTEVTIGQYAEFLAAKGDDVSGQPAHCSWNTKYAPEVGEITDELTLPMTFVDWCDARAFCEWADKRLCGAILGGPVAEADATTATISQWFRGCGGPNGDTHPTLDGINYDECNDFAINYLVAAGTTCEGSYAGLFDTQGNADEWIDSCAGETGPDDECLLLGGSYIGVGSDYCTEVTTYVRSERAEPFGFRCCSK